MPPETPVPVSVIVPVYNGESFVDRCIACLKAQTLGSFECIFVDDCSSDGTAEAIRRLTAGDHRFRLIRQPRRTDPLRCRRAGAMSARGDYVMFLDADDEFVPEACETALSVIRREGADLFIFGSTVVGESGVPEKEIAGSQKFIDQEPVSGRMDITPENLPLLFGKASWSPSVWNKIVRTDILKTVYGSIHADGYLGYGQDFLQTILVFLSIKTLFSDVGAKLHRYHLGNGATVRAQGGLSLDKFSRIMSSSNTAEALLSFLNGRHDLPPALSSDIATRFVGNFLENAARYIWFLPDAEIPRGLAVARQTWGPSLFSTRAFAEPRILENLESILRSPALERKKGPVRTVCLIRADADGERPGLALAADALEQSLASAGFRIHRATDAELAAELPANGTTSTCLLHALSSSDSIRRMANLSELLQSRSIDFVLHANPNHRSFLSDLLCARSMGCGTAIVRPIPRRDMLRRFGAPLFLRLSTGALLAGRAVGFGPSGTTDSAAPFGFLELALPPPESIGPVAWSDWFERTDPSEPAPKNREGAFLSVLAALADFEKQKAKNERNKGAALETQLNIWRGKAKRNANALKATRRSLSFRLGHLATRPFALLASLGH